MAGQPLRGLVRLGPVLGLFYADGVCYAAPLAKLFILFRSPHQKTAPKPAQVPRLVTFFFISVTPPHIDQSLTEM